MRPRTGWEYCAAFRPLLARNWSVAAQRRFSSVLLAVSLSDGAIQCMFQGDQVLLRSWRRKGSEFNGLGQALVWAEETGRGGL